MGKLLVSEVKIRLLFSCIIKLNLSTVQVLYPVNEISGSRKENASCNIHNECDDLPQFLSYVFKRLAVSLF
jgi:hypothetical protein